MLAAAANASSHASTSALTTTVKAAVEPAASPFAQLLRGSRFATYDPQIRKTYYSPKQFVERGYWGLKRPITQRKKNSFITVTQWETRQHYVEWDNAEDQVRFVRRIEELNVRPGAQDHVNWVRQLGSAKNEWLVDSEFAPHSWPVAPAKGEETIEQTAREPSQHIAFNDLGNKGSGAYGARRTVTLNPGVSGATGRQQSSKPSAAVIPNVASMSPAAFERYLEKLRRLRPAFKQYLERKEEEQKKENTEREIYRAQNPGKAVANSLEPQIAGKSLLSLAQVQDGPYHRLFIAQHTESEYQTTNRIQPQPHRNGALMYSHPSMLDSLFHNKMKPGIVLSVEKSAGRWTEETEKERFVTSFAGVAALVDTADAFDKVPLMNPGVDVENWPMAVAEMRPVTRSALGVVDVPRVVGRYADRGLRGTRIRLDVTVQRGFDDPRRKNPHVPGSRKYVALEGLDTPREGASRSTRTGLPPAAAPRPLQSLKNPPARTSTPSIPSIMFQQEITQSQEVNQHTLARLQNILGPTSKPEPRDDEM
jgi:hypothetical protein